MTKYRRGCSSQLKVPTAELEVKPYVSHRCPIGWTGKPKYNSYRKEKLEVVAMGNSD